MVLYIWYGFPNLFSVYWGFFYDHLYAIGNLNKYMSDPPQSNHGKNNYTLPCLPLTSKLLLTGCLPASAKNWYPHSKQVKKRCLPWWWSLGGQTQPCSCCDLNKRVSKRKKLFDLKVKHVGRAGGLCRSSHWSGPYSLAQANWVSLIVIAATIILAAGQGKMATWGDNVYICHDPPQLSRPYFI